jgi:hypothetical protein
MNNQLKKSRSSQWIAVIALLLLPLLFCAQTVGVFYDSKVPQIQFAVQDVKAALESKGLKVALFELAKLQPSYANKKVVIALASNKNATKMLIAEGATLPSGLGDQAYGLRTTSKKEQSYWVIGGDVNGAMYGTLQLAENIDAKGVTATYNSQEKPFMENRGMKLNMPLDRRIPTYVGRWTATSAGLSIPHVWDITFWKKLIDQQARYRYNMLSVWVHHPFPALVKVPGYEKACLPNIEGFDGFVKEMNHEQRVAFWREVMQYAHNRGMKFYFFNWNIHLEHATTAYPEITESRTNATTSDYMYKSMQQLITTYPNLDGFGISAGDGMQKEEQGFNKDSSLKTQWTYGTIGQAVTDFLIKNPSRKFNLIHRGIGTDPELVEKEYAPLKALPNATVNFSHKYAQAHMYSTTTPRWTGSIEKCTKLNMKSWITVRNDDYYYINWGDPKFVRDFMAGIPDKKNILGMYIGSDCYTPSRTYFYKDKALNGQLEVERRWYMEMLWGRIAYNPETKDDVFKNLLAKRFPKTNSENVFDAWSLASRSLPKATELIMEKWSLDFDWYPEGCNSEPGRCTGFRTVYDFANMSTHKNAKITTVAKGSNLCDISTSAADACNGKKSSYAVADEMQADAEKALSLINTVKANGNNDLQLAINNIKQMSYLSLYYAHKVRGATFLKANQVEKARDEMAMAYCQWMSYSRSMGNDYIGTAFRSMKILPDWTYADADVLKDYTDLGGVGIPSCK